MTENELHRWRSRVPVIIFGIGVTPLVAVTHITPEEFIITAAALVFGFFYRGTGLGSALWRVEKSKYVSSQIRAAVLDMIPLDLGVTSEEKELLAKQAVYGELAGVFWEAIEADPTLRSQKEHFYSNGIWYSTSLDVYLIGTFFGLCYAVLYVATTTATFAYLAAACTLIAILSRLTVTPSRRKYHLSLSKEQLDLLRRKQSDFVANQFRSIISGWRSNKPPVSE